MVILSLKVVLRAGLEPTTICQKTDSYKFKNSQKQQFFHDFFIESFIFNDIWVSLKI